MYRGNSIGCLSVSILTGEKPNYGVHVGREQLKYSIKASSVSVGVTSDKVGVRLLGKKCMTAKSFPANRFLISVEREKHVNVKCSVQSVKANVFGIKSAKVETISNLPSAYGGSAIAKPKVRCSIICSVSKDSYMNVSPDVVWLSPDMLSAEFNIYSNVDWVII